MRTSLSLFMFLLIAHAATLMAAPASSVDIEWDLRQPACASPFVLSQDIKSKSLILRPEDFTADSSSGRYLATCRLQGRILIPKGYALAEDIQAKARFTARELAGDDRVEVQSRVSIANMSDFSSDSIDLSGTRDEGTWELNTELTIPSVKACEAAKQFRISFSNKLLINSRLDSKSGLNASFDQLQIAPLRLVSAPCEDEGRPD